MNSQIFGAFLFGFGLCGIISAFIVRDGLSAFAAAIVIGCGGALVLYDPVPQQFGVIDHEAARQIRLAQQRALANAGY